MSMQLRIVHRSEYAYDGGAMASHNQARMTPVTTPEQIVVHHRVDVTPKPWVSTYTDYFGCAVTAFEIVDPHDRMTVTAHSTVHVNRDAVPTPTTDWPAYAEREISDRWTEFLVLPDLVAPPEDLGREVAAIGASGALPGEAALMVCALVHDRVALLPGTAGGESPAAAAWEGGVGASHDVVHLAIGALRSLGIPARYVSGYVHPAAEPVIDETVEGAAHAWLEWWDDGWQGFDPSAGAAPDDRYVAIGHGRDHSDLPPLRGIYSGAQTAALDVRIEITRLG